MAGVSAGAGVLGNIFGPRAPDVVRPVIASYQNQMGAMSAAQAEQTETVFDQAQSAGMSGSSMLRAADNIFKANSRERAALDALAADKIAEAQNRQDMVNYQNRAQRHQMMMQGVGVGAQIAGTYLSMPATPVAPAAATAAVPAPPTYTPNYSLNAPTPQPSMNAMEALGIPQYQQAQPLGNIFSQYTLPNNGVPQYLPPMLGPYSY